MLAESALWTFCQNKIVMLTYTHNHAPAILLDSALAIETKKKISTLSLTMTLI